MNWRSKITFQQPTYQTNDEWDRYQALLFYIYIYIYISIMVQLNACLDGEIFFI